MKSIQPVKKISKQQKLNLELIALAHHNDLNGEVIHQDLIKNKELWTAVYGYFFYFYLIPIRDMHLGWHIDSIAITYPKNKINTVRKMVRKWNPTEIYEFDQSDINKEVGSLRNNNMSLIVVWWD